MPKQFPPNHDTSVLMEKMQIHVEEIELQLRMWGETISELVANIENIDSEARVDYQRRIDEIKMKHAHAQSKLLEFRSADAEKWEKFRLDVEKARDDLALALATLRGQ